MIPYDIAAQKAQPAGNSLADSPSAPQPAVAIVVGSSIVWVGARDARELIGRNIESFGRIAPFTAG